MSITVKELTKHADSLCSEDDECFARSAVSRHYYAAYHATEAWEAALTHRGTDRTGVGAHERLLHRLDNPAVTLPPAQQKASKMIAKMLRPLRDRRTKADYKLATTMTSKEGRQHQGEVKSLLGYLHSTHP